MKPNREFPGRERLEDLLLESRTRTLSAVEREELNAILRADESARTFAAQTLMDDAALAEELRAEQMESLLAADSGGMLGASYHPPAATRRVWFQWRPLMAASAGIVLGIFCTSIVLAYVAPSLGKAVTLLDDSFESGPPPLVTGVAVEAGRWSGDYTEVVGEQQGVKPESGQKMLRLLRADYEGKTNAKESYVADIYRMVDMRPYRQEFADGGAVVQLSAGFNAFDFPTEEIYSAKMSIHAFDAESVTNGTLRAVSAWDENCLAAASTGAARLDRKPATWERRTSDLRLPANTDFLLIHMMIQAGRGPRPEASFAGHFIDDVSVTLRHSPLR